MTENPLSLRLQISQYQLKNKLIKFDLSQSFTDFVVRSFVSWALAPARGEVRPNGPVT